LEHPGQENIKPELKRITMAQSVISIGADVICAETLKMFIPDGGAHVRQVGFFLPRLQPNPTVVATVYSDQSPGNVFGVWAIDIVDTGTQTQIKVSATNTTPGYAVPFDYFCSLIVVGQAAIEE
jgi:hypothetical protein